MMDIEKLIEDLHGILKQYGEKIPYGELISAPWPYSRAGDLVWPDPEPYFIEQAATALSTLHAENEKLRSEAEGMRSNWYKSVEEIQKLRAELEQVKRERDDLIEDFVDYVTGGVPNPAIFCKTGVINAPICVVGVPGKIAKDFIRPDRAARRRTDNDKITRR